MLLSPRLCRFLLRLQGAEDYASSSASFSSMSSYMRRQRSVAVAKADERLLAELGYKQEFQREFTPLEVYFTSYLLQVTSLPLTHSQLQIFGISFNIVGLLPSIASVPCPLMFSCIAIRNHLQLSPLLFYPQWRSGGDGLGGKRVSFSLA